MRLKSLEMLGFKSFPDKTVLSFGEGVTIIVGPNGSGKSNISDAVRWVLGEISSKNMRGTKMEDVIFGGTDERSQMGFAEVTLNIENTDSGTGLLASDYNEVSVTRRFYRSGESEYMINRKAVRLRDITELFMHTGLGRSGYSIIGQGKIAEIISQRSEERRNIFEEAGGISKYRFQKNEAERKLREVNDNILRAEDIYRELEARVGPLEEESARARKYLELYEKKKSLDVSLSLFDITKIREQIKTLECEYTAAGLALSAADDELARLEAEGERAFLEAQQRNLLIEQTDRLIREKTERRHELDGLIKVADNDLLHIGEQTEKTTSELAADEAALTELENKTAALQSSGDAKASELKGLEDELSETGHELSLLSALRDQARLTAGEKTAALSAENEKLVSLRLKLSELSGVHIANTERQKALKAELASKDNDVADTLRQINEAQLAADSHTADAERIKNAITELDEQLKAAAKTEEAAVRRLSDLKLEHSQLMQRADALRRMEEHFEGYIGSVRSVMNAANAGRLSGIEGPVSKLITVPAKYSVAVETALGQNLQNIVTCDESAAKAAINHLKAAGAGRATFYPMTTIRAQSLAADETDFKKYPGYAGIASSLIRFDAKYADVIKYLLGRTLVFDNIDNAQALAAAYGYRFRIVTTDGQLINAGGSFTGGSVKTSSGILSRSAEIEKLMRSDAGLKAAMAAAEAEADGCEEQKNDLMRKSAELSGKLSLAQSICQADSTRLEVMKSSYENKRAAVTALNAELERLKAQLVGGGEYDRLTSDISGLEAAIGELSNSRGRFIAEAEDIDKKIKQLNDDRNGLVFNISELRAECEILQSKLSLSVEASSTLTEKCNGMRTLLASFAEKAVKANSDILLYRNEAETLDGEIAALNEKLLSERTLREETDKKTSENRIIIKDKTHLRENLFREYTRLDSKNSAAASEQDRLIGKLWEDYELTYSAAAELPYPPIKQEERSRTVSVLTDLRCKIKALGDVNIGAIEEYKTVRERYDFYGSQLSDLDSSRCDISSIITGLEKEMCARFLDIMKEISRNFSVVFRELFGGGTAELTLTDPANVLESGIEINVAPPGKIIKSLSLLSGGEQSFVAIALLFAILNVNPTPFCVLDEIEAALDEVNVARFAEYVKRYSDKTQFIIITHRRGTMEIADTIYGVTMAKRGISKVLSIDVNEVAMKIGVKLT